MTREGQALKVYQKLINKDFIESLESSCEVVDLNRAGIFSSIVTVWLMIFQRLNGDKTLEAAVLELQSGQSRELLDERSVRVRNGRISGATGGYSRARSRLPLSVVEKVSDAIESALLSTHEKKDYRDRRVFIIDGSTIRLPHTENNCDEYPQYRNQHGKAHYPLMRVSVATDAVSGISLRPAYGAYNGEAAVNELGLAEELFPRIPAESIVIGDRFYGNARFAATALLNRHDCVCRVKERDAKRFIGTPKAKSGECSVTWESIRSRNKKDYSVNGRFIWHTSERKGYQPQLFIFFTTLDWSIEEIVKLYGLRWNVELDLRDMKSILSMDMLSAKSPDMIAKELVLGVVAYNLVRHLMSASAKQLKVTPREISFSKTLKRIRAIHAGVLAEQTTDLERALHYLFRDAKNLKIPKRNKARPSEPRKVWPKGQIKIMTSTREEERQKIVKNHATDS